MMTEMQTRIWNTLLERDYGYWNFNKTKKIHNRIGVFIDGEYYESLFQAGIDSPISYQWINKIIHRSNGAPVELKNAGVTIVTEKWIRQHPEYLM